MLFVGLTRVGEFDKTCCFVTPSFLEFICSGRPVDITYEFDINMSTLFSVEFHFWDAMITFSIF